MSFSGWIRLKRCRWREVVRAAALWGPGGCWAQLLRVQVFDDCDRVALESRRSPGRGSVRMKVQLEELARAGQAMRKAQNAYFKGGDKGRSDRLAEAKQAERHFDALVKAVLDPEAPGLFDQEGG